MVSELGFPYKTLPRPVTVPAVRQCKGYPIVAITAYDFITASIAEEAGVDIVLVGDSVGTVLQGHPTTLPVTLDEMIYHTKCVEKALKNPLIVVDLPFGTFQVGVEETIRATVRVLKETKAQGVKIEGGRRVEKAISALTKHDIPVMGHLGLTPQSVRKFGGHKRQGSTLRERREIFEDALRLEDAGVFAIVLECIPEDLAEKITTSLSIPTIGIGSGSSCDGQIGVFHDLVGLTPKPPRFVTPYAHLREEAIQAVRRYVEEVRGVVLKA